MKTKKRTASKGLLLLICCFSAAAICISCVSWFYYERSVMATLSEFFMVLVDRDVIYEEGDGYIENLELRRTENLKDYEIPEVVKMKSSVTDTHEHDMQVFYVNKESASKTVILYIPGGAYLNNPLNFHWTLIDNLAQKTDCQIVVPIYLKVPHYTCKESHEKMIEFYLDLASREGVERTIFMGDSSGGGMALSIAQQLRDMKTDITEPEELILIVPWLDVSMETEGVEEIEKVDTMLGIYGLKDIGRMWAGEKDILDPMVSPIYGTFEDLGHITMFAGTKDMLYPDIVKLSEMLDEQGIEHTCVIKKNLVHPYPLFPIPEAKEAQELMIEIINSKK